MQTNTESFVLYETVYETFNQLAIKVGKEVACDFMQAICEYGLYGVVPEDDDILWVYGLSTVFHTINCAKDRYEASKENGKKGGRPTKLSDEDQEIICQMRLSGKTAQNIADELGYGLNTIKRSEGWKAGDPKTQNPTQN